MVTDPAVIPLASPMTTTSFGSSTNWNGSSETSTCVGMSVDVEASTLPLFASQMFFVTGFCATVTTVERPSS